MRSIALQIFALLALVPAIATAQSDAPNLCPMTSASGEPLAPDAGEAFALANRARAEIDAGRSDGIAEMLEAALAAADGLDGASRAQLEIHLGRSFERLGQHRRAAELFRLASDHAHAAGSWRLHSYALGYLGALYETAGRGDEALELTRRALFSAHRAPALDALYRWQWQVGRIQRAQGNGDASIAAYREAVATLSGVRELGGPDVAALYMDFVDLLLQRARAASGDEQQLLLAEVRNALEDQKAAELRDYFQDACLDARRKQSPDLVPGTLVVYPVELADRLVLIASREGVLASYEVPVDRETFNAEVLAFRRGLMQRTSRRYRLQARKLYEWLIRPLEPALDSGEVSTLVFVPGGALRTIPLAALQDPDTGDFLIEKIPVAITPGLTLTDPRSIDRGRVRLLAAGISESVQGYPELENVSEEIDSIHALFPGRKLMNGEFVAGRFESEFGERPFEIVHLASHGEFSSDVSESFLLTYDGRVSMEQLAVLVGSTRFRERGLELLTLSACETATGDDRAALGLAGVAVRSGARSALATLWSVNDSASALLVTEFYQQLSNPEISRAEALQRAQLKVLGMRSFKHPGYWAPYLLIGSWL